MIALRDQYIDAVKVKAENLAERVAGGGMNVQQWTLEMRQLVKATYVDEYAMARGGRQMMTQRDWGILGSQIKSQYKFLAGFERDMMDGKLSEGQARVRAGMYVESGTQAFERGKAEGLGIPSLPAYPGDGSTQCRANCRCHWQIDDMGAEWHATWTLGVAEHCGDCVSNASQWAPLVIAKG
jgi:hypothetical protein